MKKTILTFLKVEKILDIISLILFAVASFILIICGVVTLISLFDQVRDLFININAGAQPTEQEVAELIVPWAVPLGVGGVFLFCTLLMISSLILTGIARNKVTNATCKDDVKSAAPLAIIAGCLGNKFAVVSGVLLIVSKDEHYQ